jgi:hypothetical protein
VSSVDAEPIVMARLDDLGYTDTVVPEGKWDDIYPIIVINRLPNAGVDRDGLVDTAMIVVLTIGRDRDEAWETALKVDERILNDGLPFAVQVDGKEWVIEPTSQETPPALEPDINPDPRFIDATYSFPVSLRF